MSSARWRQGAGVAVTTLAFSGLRLLEDGHWADGAVAGLGFGLLGQGLRQRATRRWRVPVPTRPGDDTGTVTSQVA